MITYREINKSLFSAYDSVPMRVAVTSHFVLEKVNEGLGGILFREEPVASYVKDLGKYEQASQYAEKFNLTHWAFFMAFDDDIAVGGVTIASRTDNVTMLDGRDDLSVLWDIRVADEYKRKGVGQSLFDLAVNWSKQQGLKQMKIECQSNNVPACKFYHKQGAALGKLDTYAYYKEPEIRHEVQLIWYFDLIK